MALAVPLLTEEDRHARLRQLAQHDTPQLPDAPKPDAAGLIEQAARRPAAAGKRATALAVNAHE